MTTMPMPYETAPDDCWDSPEYAVSPGPVTPDVSPAVTPPVTPAVTSGVTPPGNGDHPGGGNDPRSLDWLGTSEWVTEPGEPAAREARSAPGIRLRGHLSALAGSELAGGGPGGLLAELAAPAPETLRQHWRHVAGHPQRPAGPWAGPAFTAGHLAVTAPAKLTGKALVILGTALVFAGTRIDWSGDRFARISTCLAIVAALAIIVLVFG